jgi:branched-chain amino acid transport system substrate-binding protein
MAVLLLVAAACGDDDSDDSSGSDTGGSSDDSGDSDGSETAGDSTEPIKIGYAAAVSGVLAPYESVPGATCAVEIINDNGGVLGRQLELVVRDMKSDPVEATIAAQELVDEGVSVILGPATDDVNVPVALVAEPHDIAMLGVGATAPALPQSASNGFLVAYGDNVSHAGSAEIAIEEGLSTVYFLTSPDAGGYSLFGPVWLAETMEALGGEIVGRDTFQYGQNDYSAQVTAIASMDPHPDVISMGALMPDGATFIRQLRAAGVESALYATDGFDDPQLTEIAGTDADGTTFTTHGFPAEGTRLKEFYDECESRGHTVENIFFGLAGDAIEYVKLAIEATGSAEPADVQRGIDELDGIQAITASTVTFLGQEGVPLKSLAVVRVIDGEFVLVQQDFVPSNVPSPEPPE